MEELSIQLNGSSIVSGKEVTGYIILNTSKEIEARQIVFLFTGKEITYFKRQSSSGKYYKEYNGKNKFIRVETVIYEWKNWVLEPGEYRFPFVFEIPYELPGSFEIKCKKAYGLISYYVKVRVEDLRRIAVCKSKTNIKIIQDIDLKENPSTEFITPLHSCNCFYRGHCVTNILLQKNRFFTGESCSIKIFVDNSHSKVNITNLECIVWLVCRFISSERQVNYFRKCIYFHQHQDTIKYSDTCSSPKEICIEAPLEHEKIDISNCSVTFGKFIQCTYNLQVTLEYGDIITEEPDLQMPINVTLKEDGSTFLIEDSVLRISREFY